MITPISTTIANMPIDISTELKSYSRSNISLLSSCLAFTNLGAEFNAQVDAEPLTLTLKEPVARLLILFLKTITDEDDLGSACSKLLPLYHEAIADAQKGDDYKIENYLLCEYCKYVVYHSSDKNEIYMALSIQEDLLDDYNFGLKLIDQKNFGDTYEEHLKRILVLIKKYYEIDQALIFSNSTRELISFMATKLSTISCNDKTPIEICQYAKYHYAYLIMRMDNLDLLDLPQAYNILKRLLTEKISDSLFSKVNFRLAELIRQCQNQFMAYDNLMPETTSGQNEMRKLYSTVIKANNDNQMKVKALYAYSQTFCHPEFKLGVNLSTTRNALCQILELSNPSSILIPLAQQQLGTMSILGINKDKININAGKEYLKKALNCELFNTQTVCKLKKFLQVEPLSEVIIEKETIDKNKFYSKEKLAHLRKILTNGIEYCIEENLDLINDFYNVHSPFCIEHKNFNADVFKSLGEVELKRLKETTFSSNDQIFIVYSQINQFKEEIFKTVFPYLYLADKMLEENPQLSLHLYQVSLSIVFTLVSCMRGVLFNKVNIGQPQYIGLTNEYIQKNGRFYLNVKQNNKNLWNEDLFSILDSQQNDGNFSEVMNQINLWVNNFKNEDMIITFEHPEKCINGFELQTVNVSGPELLPFMLLSMWNLFNKLTFRPNYKEGFVFYMISLTQHINNFYSSENVTNAQKSQASLINMINLAKLDLMICKKIYYQTMTSKLVILNKNLCALIGMLSNEEKIPLTRDIAGFNGDFFLSKLLILKKQHQSYRPFYDSILLYIKLFLSTKNTYDKIEVLEEMFSFGPKTADDYIEMIQALQKFQPEFRNDYEVYLAFYISYRIEYYLLKNQKNNAEDLINMLDKGKFNFINKDFAQTLLSKFKLKVEFLNEGKYTFQLYKNDPENRKAILAQIGPFFPPEIRCEFEISTKKLTQSVSKVTPSSKKSRSLKRSDQSIPSQSTSYSSYPDKIDNTPYSESLYRTPSTTFTTKKAAAEKIEKESNKKSIKQERNNSQKNIEDATVKIIPSIKPQVVKPKISISIDAKLIFDKLWIPHKGAINLDSEIIDAKNYKNKIQITKNEVQTLVKAFNGSYVQGKGSHEKCILTSIDKADKITIDGETIHIANFTVPERSTMPLPKTESKKDPVDGFLVLQLRTKLIELGYTPFSVVEKKS